MRKIRKVWLLGMIASVVVAGGLLVASYKTPKEIFFTEVQNLGNSDHLLIFPETLSFAEVQADIPPLETISLPVRTVNTILEERQVNQVSDRIEFDTAAYHVREDVLLKELSVLNAPAVETSSMKNSFRQLLQEESGVLISQPLQIEVSNGISRQAISSEVFSSINRESGILESEIQEIMSIPSQFSSDAQ